MQRLSSRLPLLLTLLVPALASNAPLRAQVPSDLNAAPKAPASLPPEEQLMQAMNKRDWATVKTLIDANPKLLQGNPREGRYGGSAVLNRAIGAAQTDMVAYLLEKGVDPNIEYGGTSALNTAMTMSSEGWKEIAEALLAKGANVNRVDSDGNTPLSRVIEYGNNRKKERIEWLLSKGADVNLRGRSDTSPIERAFSSGSSLQPDILKLMLDKVDVKLPNEDGRTLLHMAVTRGSSDAVKALIEKGANINAQDGIGNTPLHLVVTNSNVNAALLNTLLEAGANPNIKNNRGDLPLHLALRRVESNSSRYSSYGSDERYNENAVPRGTVLSPLTDKTDINVRDRFGVSSLLLALECRDTETHDIIMDKAPKMDATTQLFEAAASGNVELLTKLLTQKPYLVYFRLPDGTTPLHTSALWGTLGAATFLVAKGANVNARDARGETPLHATLTRPTGKYLRRAKNMEAFLLSKGADINALDSADRSPLMRAVTLGEVEFVKTLLDQGANPNYKDSQLATPLMAAISRNAPPAIIQALLDKGANINTRDQEGATALSRAIMARQVQTVKLLFAKGATLASANNPRGSSEGRTALGQLVSNYREYDEYGRNSEDATREIFAILLEKGADPNEKIYNEPIVNRLLSSGASGANELLKMLLATKKVPLGATTERPALIITAVQQGRREVIETLLAAGASINEKDVNGNGLLALAKRRNDESLTAFLVGKGAKE